MPEPETTGRTNWPEQLRYVADAIDTPGDLKAQIMRLAADEIERLRDELATANSRIIYLETELHG